MNTDDIIEARFNAENTRQRLILSGVISSPLAIGGVTEVKSPHTFDSSSVTILHERVKVLEHEEIQNNLRIEELEEEISNIKLNLGNYTKKVK